MYLQQVQNIYVAYTHHFQKADIHHSGGYVVVHDFGKPLPGLKPNVLARAAPCLSLAKLLPALCVFLCFCSLFFFLLPCLFLILTRRHLSTNSIFFGHPVQPHSFLPRHAASRQRRSHTTLCCLFFAAVFLLPASARYGGYACRPLSRLLFSAGHFWPSTRPPLSWP